MTTPSKNDDPDKFAEPAKVRFTLELSEKGKAKIHIEEAVEKSRNDFGGKLVAIPSIPKLNFQTRPDGMSKLVFDFKEPIPANMPIFKFGDRYDPAKKSLLFEPPEKEPGKFDDGGCLFGLPPNICQLPMTVSVDAVVTHRGEWCNMEFIFFDCVFFCHVYSNGKEFPDDLEINCRFGTPVAPKNRVYKEVLRMKNVLLDEPFEATFPASQLKGKENEFFRGGIARNLNREEGIEVNRHPLEIKCVSFEGRLTLPSKEK